MSASVRNGLQAGAIAFVLYVVISLIVGLDAASVVIGALVIAAVAVGVTIVVTNVIVARKSQ